MVHAALAFGVGVGVVPGALNIEAFPTWSFPSGVAVDTQQLRLSALSNFLVFALKSLLVLSLKSTRFNLIKSTCVLVRIKQAKVRWPVYPCSHNYYLIA